MEQRFNPFEVQFIQFSAKAIIRWRSSRISTRSASLKRNWASPASLSIIPSVTSMGQICSFAGSQSPRKDERPTPADFIIFAVLMANSRPIVMSGIRPTGFLHLGNYFGAVQNYVRMQEEYECFSWW